MRKEYIQALKTADRGDYTLLIELMKTLGACDPKLNELFSNKFYTPIIRSDKGKFLVKALLRMGGDPNDTTPSGHCSLQLGVKAGLKEIVPILINSGAKIDSVDRSGMPPFQIAIAQRDKPMADLLLSYGAKQQLPLDS